MTSRTAGSIFEERVEKIVHKRLGAQVGREFMNGWERSRSDIEFAAYFLLGMELLPWQKTDVFDAFDAGPIVSVGRLSNAGGKTTSFMLLYLLGCGTRRWAAPDWGLYRAIHFTPLRDMGNETRIKIDEALRGHAREQWDERRQEFRRAPLRHFVRAMKFGQNMGYEFFGEHDKKYPERDFVSATLTLMPTAGKGESGEGSDPMIIGLDEGRHERNLLHIFYRIWVPRALRVESKIYIPYTSLEASPDLEDIKEQAEADTNNDFHEFDLELETANPTLKKKQVERVLRILPPDIREQVRTGKAMQPTGARFSAKAVQEGFGPPPEPANFSQLTGLRERVMKRCPICQAKARGATSPLIYAHQHLMCGAMDPSSSARGADYAVLKVWDLEPPPSTGHMAETVFTKTLQQGIRVQELTREFVALGREIQGPCGYDRKGAFGHAVEDLTVEMDDEIEIVPIQWDSREQKMKDVDFFKALVEGGHWWSPYHHHTKTQAMNWVPDDRRMVQDHLMAEVIAAATARPYLVFGELYETPDGERHRYDAPDNGRYVIGNTYDGLATSDRYSGYGRE